MVLLENGLPPRLQVWLTSGRLMMQAGTVAPSLASRKVAMTNLGFSSEENGGQMRSRIMRK